MNEYTVWRQVRGDGTAYMFYVMNLSPEAIKRHSGDKVTEFSVAQFPVNRYQVEARAREDANKYCDYLNRIVVAEANARKEINYGHSTAG